jgi:pyruvate,orthophosphate dikinase
MGTGALEANLARTAIEVVVPEEHAVLLEITAPWRGVHDATAELLREVHHRYVGWPQTLADLHRRATADFGYHNGHERGAEALAIVSDLYAKVVRDATPAALRGDALRRWLAYLEKIARDSGPHLARNVPVIEGALVAVARAVHLSPDLAAPGSSGLRRLGQALAGRPDHPAPGALEATLHVLRPTLDTVYERWLAHDDPAVWWQEIHAEAGLAGGAAPAFLPGHDRMQALRRALSEDATDLLALPDATQIVRSFMEAADAIGAGAPRPRTLMARIHWLIRVLEHPDLEPVQETALHEVSRTCSDLLADGAGIDREALVREVFALLRHRPFPYRHTVLGLTERIGREVLRLGDAELSAVLVAEMLDTDFEYPAFSGFTEEWGLRANPAHVEAIRTHLRIIAADPAAARPLLAALVGHLRLGGVSVPDSALLPREVSALLASDVRPVWVPVKHLLRLLPVYFGEIGSEGELREVSTRIDEALQRHDPLCHFLRKQSHVECNPHLVEFVEEIARFWATGDPEPLRAYAPPSVVDGLDIDDPVYRGLHTAFAELVSRQGSIEGVFSMHPDAVRDALTGFPGVDGVDREKAELLVRVWREIRRKYALDHADVIARLRAYGRVDAALLNALEDSLARDDLAGALDLCLTVLERLRAIVLTPGESRPVESIYLKRHIAVGIPSVYGSYREDRLDAVGLTFRLESLASALADRVMDVDALPAEPRARLAVVAHWLRLLQRALRIDGFRARGIAHCLLMLDEVVAAPAASESQVADVFRLLSRNVESLVRARILEVYEQPLRRVATRMIERGLITSPAGASADEAVLMRTEGLLRELIASSLGLQRLDALVGRMLNDLGARGRAPDVATAAAIRTPDVRASVVDIRDPAGREGIVSLGGKGYMLRELVRLGMPVPEGFILTTDLFPFRHELCSPGPLRERLEERVRAEIRRLEHGSGARFGDPARPLLLSVRGGAPLSMPGMLTTFLDVGMTPRVAAGLAAERGAWAAWDAYRRFVQFWGMSQGVSRDPFDEAMRDAKQRNRVPRKAMLPPEEMRTLALGYEALVWESGVEVFDDPFAQLMRCIELVQTSWDSESARLYRRETLIADEWGTAVIVQAMVFGNVGPRSGTGVVLTSDPGRPTDAVELWGDFAVQAQGDDVVGGVVETHPITERQRRREARGGVSLEKDFPEIHAALAAIARVLVEEKGLNHQEIEFTFESDRAEDLYLLQARDAVVAPSALLPAFVPTPALDASRVASGIGVSGGALTGRVAHTVGEIAQIESRFPGEPVILLRPDTVPDDIALVLRADGVLTALGGATSHAAVAAKRLGKTCVVGCRSLDVDERAARSRIGAHELHGGDVISMSGLDGTVYLGSHPAEMVRVSGRAEGASAGSESGRRTR